MDEYGGHSVLANRCTDGAGAPAQYPVAQHNTPQ